MEHGINEKYDKRLKAGKDKYYDLRPENYAIWVEFDREIAKISLKIERKSAKVLIVGCGYGSELLLLLRYGFDIHNIFCVDILSERINYINSLFLGIGGAKAEEFNTNTFPGVTFDLILCSTVLSSISSQEKRLELLNIFNTVSAKRSVIAIYDLIYRNPSNKDVTPINRKLIIKSFKNVSIITKKVTILPALSRKIFHKNTHIFNILQFFSIIKTHKFYFVFIERE
jgi:SAM-dependent methyltransferase